MVVYYPNKPSDFTYEIKYNSPHHIRIINILYTCVACILIFYITSGKYINGYNQNGTRIFSIKLPIDVSKLLIDENKIDYI